MGISEGGAQENGGDVEMVEAGASKRRIIVGSADLNFKRDRMEIQPLFQENGISKHKALRDYWLVV